MNEPLVDRLSAHRVVPVRERDRRQLARWQREDFGARIAARGEQRRHPLRYGAVARR
jgi:hypothetical protein